MSDEVTVHELATAVSINVDNLSWICVQDEDCDAHDEQVEIIQSVLEEIIERTR